VPRITSALAVTARQCILASPQPADETTPVTVAGSTSAALR
jgi:hypothetical protein